MKTLLVVVTVVMLGYLGWDHFFSRAAKIERAYQACMKQINTGMDRAKADVDAKTANGNDPSAALAKGMSNALTAMMQGMGGAMCGTIKETCNQDFYGPVCQSALTNSR